MKLIVTAPQRSAERLAALERDFPTVQIVSPDERETVPSVIGDADAVFGTLTADEFANARELRWIQSPSAGVEWVARVPALISSDVVVTNMRGAHAATIAEHAFAMLLTLTRALRSFEVYQNRHEWARGEIIGQMRGIKGLTMGIIGFGNIGRAIARRATGFEMNVLAVDAQPVTGSDGVSSVWPLTRLDDLCAASDVLVIAAPITRETRGMVGGPQLARLPHGAYLLAMSRGGIVDEPALLDALRAGRLAGAGLDVTATEPLPAEDPLWDAPNTIITPHSSPVSTLTSDLVWSILADNVGRFVRGEPLINVIDKELGY